MPGRRRKGQPPGLFASPALARIPLADLLAHARTSLTPFGRFPWECRSRSWARVVESTRRFKFSIQKLNDGTQHIASGSGVGGSDTRAQLRDRTSWNAFQQGQSLLDPWSARTRTALFACFWNQRIWLMACFATSNSKSMCSLRWFRAGM